MDITSYILGKKSAGGGGSNLKYVVVEELPTTGEDNTIYLVPKSTSGTNNYYDEYMYISNEWEKIGDTEVDLSSKQDVMQFATMPTASSSNEGKIIQYTGTTGNDYTNGHFYKCVSDGQNPATYSWTEASVQDLSSKQDTLVSGTNIKTINSTSLLGSGDIAVQEILTSGTNIKTINNNSLLGEGNITVGGANYTAGTNIEITNAGVINNKIPYFSQVGSVGLGSSVSLDYYCTAIGASSAGRQGSVVVGNNANGNGSKNGTIVIGQNAKALNNGITGSIVMGYKAKPTKDNQMMVGSSDLPVNEIAMTTSNGEKTLATTDFLTTVTGYDATKTQVLKNVNGTLTWIDEA